MSNEDNPTPSGEFIDAETYLSSGKDNISFKIIVLRHLQKISTYASVEFRGGYWQTRTKPLGNTTISEKVYVADTREIFSNSVEFLFDICFAHFDKEMLSAGVTADQEIKKALHDNTIIKEKDRESDDIRSFKNIDDRISFRSRRREINRILLRELCCFLKRINYFESEVKND